MAFTELIAATNDYDSATLSVTDTTTITADDLTGDEEVLVEVAKVGSGYKQLFSQGRRIVLTANNNTEIIVGPADYNIIKNKTVNAVAVGYQTI